MEHATARAAGGDVAAANAVVLGELAADMLGGMVPSATHALRAEIAEDVSGALEVSPLAQAVVGDLSNALHGHRSARAAARREAEELAAMSAESEAKVAGGHHKHAPLVALSLAWLVWVLLETVVPTSTYSGFAAQASTAAVVMISTFVFTSSSDQASRDERNRLRSARATKAKRKLSMEQALLPSSATPAVVRDGGASLARFNAAGMKSEQIARSILATVTRAEALVRGFRVSEPMPPVARIEANRRSDSSMQCVELRRALLIGLRRYRRAISVCEMALATLARVANGSDVQSQMRAVDVSLSTGDSISVSQVAALRPPPPSRSSVPGSSSVEISSDDELLLLNLQGVLADADERRRAAVDHAVEQICVIALEHLTRVFLSSDSSDSPGRDIESSSTDVGSVIQRLMELLASARDEAELLEHSLQNALKMCDADVVAADVLDASTAHERIDTADRALASRCSGFLMSSSALREHLDAASARLAAVQSQVRTALRLSSESSADSRRDGAPGTGGAAAALSGLEDAVIHAENMWKTAMQTEAPPLWSDLLREAAGLERPASRERPRRKLTTEPTDIGAAVSAGGDDNADGSELTAGKECPAAQPVADDDLGVAHDEPTEVFSAEIAGADPDSTGADDALSGVAAVEKPTFSMEELRGALLSRTSSHRGTVERPAPDWKEVDAEDAALVAEAASGRTRDATPNVLRELKAVLHSRGEAS